MMSQRFRLPNRRNTDSFDIVFRRRNYTVSIGRYPRTNEIAEVFIHSHQVASDASDDARDIAVLLSIAIQYKVPLVDMKDAVCRLDDGSPAGLAGAVLDELCK